MVGVTGFEPATGLTLRIGLRVASWSLTVQVAGEGGISARGFKKKGKRARLNLGEYPIVSLQAARAAANAYLDQAARGESPVVRLERAATTGGLTMRALGEKFLTDYVQTKELRALIKYSGALRVHVFPRVGDELAETISRANIRDLVKEVMVKQPRGDGPRDRPRGGKEAARTVIAVMRKMINWGITEDLLHAPVERCWPLGVSSELTHERRFGLRARTLQQSHREHADFLRRQFFVDPLWTLCRALLRDAMRPLATWVRSGSNTNIKSPESVRVVANFHLSHERSSRSTALCRAKSKICADPSLQ